MWINTPDLSYSFILKSLAGSWAFVLKKKIDGGYCETVADIRNAPSKSIWRTIHPF